MEHVELREPFKGFKKTCACCETKFIALTKFIHRCPECRRAHKEVRDIDSEHQLHLKSDNHGKF